jgi:hypothetical protein
MAEIVAAFGTPHDPAYPEQVTREGPQSAVARNFAEIRRQLEAVDPDVIVFFTSDHLHTFFFDNFPTFAVGLGARTQGPNDRTVMPHYDVPIEDALARRLHRHGIEHDFDLAMTQGFALDHSIMVPLHFLTPRMHVPVVPVFINGFAPPVPSAKRCLALGETVRAIVERWPADKRVAIVASGSFSLEVGGPRVHAGRLNGVPDPRWMERVCGLIGAGRVDELLNEATRDRLARAGNVAGELMNWVALLGAIGKRAATHLEGEPDDGGAFAAWRWDGGR